MQTVASAKELCMALIHLAHPLVSCWSLLAHVLDRIVFGILSLEMWRVPSLKFRWSWVALRNGINSLFQMKKVYDACKLAVPDDDEAQEWDAGCWHQGLHMFARLICRSTKRWHCTVVRKVQRKPMPLLLLPPKRRRQTRRRALKLSDCLDGQTTFLSLKELLHTFRSWCKLLAFVDVKDVKTSLVNNRSHHELSCSALDIEYHWIPLETLAVFPARISSLRKLWIVSSFFWLSTLTTFPHICYVPDGASRTRGLASLSSDNLGSLAGWWARETSFCQVS